MRFPICNPTTTRTPTKVSASPFLLLLQPSTTNVRSRLCQIQSYPLTLRSNPCSLPLTLSLQLPVCSIPLSFFSSLFPLLNSARTPLSLPFSLISLSLPLCNRLWISRFFLPLVSLSLSFVSFVLPPTKSLLFYTLILPIV